MKIEVKKVFPDRKDDHYQELYVNGIKVGEYIYGDDKKYLNPKKWAEEQLKKRNKVIDRNIKRLKTELDKWLKEKKILNQ